MKRLKTYADLKDELEAYKGEGIDRTAVLRFIAITDANMIISSCTTKDLASILQDGIKAPQTDEEVAQWLLTQYEDQESDDVQQYEIDTWNERFAYYFGE